MRIYSRPRAATRNSLNCRPPGIAEAWVRTASSVQARMVGEWENRGDRSRRRRLISNRISKQARRLRGSLIPIHTSFAEPARWKRCVPRGVPTGGNYAEVFQKTIGRVKRRVTQRLVFARL